MNLLKKVKITPDDIAAALARGASDYREFRWTPPKEYNEALRDAWWAGRNEEHQSWAVRKVETGVID